jgi:hypothetical protein
MTEYRIHNDAGRVAIVDEHGALIAAPPEGYGPGMAREWCLERLRELAGPQVPEFPQESRR